MKKKTKGLQYRLEKERDLWIIYICFVPFILALFLIVMEWIEDKEFPSDAYIPIVFLLALCCYLLYAKYSRIKRIILSRYGVRHDAEIVRAEYYNGSGRWASLSYYYLEIEFTNNRGKKKTLYTPAYVGNPNIYLKSANCSVYEWKGFYVEGDLQVRDEIDSFGHAGIPREKKHFFWR